MRETCILLSTGPLIAGSFAPASDRS